LIRNRHANPSRDAQLAEKQVNDGGRGAARGRNSAAVAPEKP
jgi:hypothetical protein